MAITSTTDTLANILKRQLKINENSIYDCQKDFSVPILMKIFTENPDCFVGTSSSDELLVKIVYRLDNFQKDVHEICNQISKIIKHFYDSEYRILFNRLEISPFNKDMPDNIKNDYFHMYNLNFYGSKEKFKFPCLEKQIAQMYYWAEDIAPRTGVCLKSVPLTEIIIKNRIDTSKIESETNFLRWLNENEFPITKQVELSIIEEFDIKSKKIRNLDQCWNLFAKEKSVEYKDMTDEQLIIYFKEQRKEYEEMKQKIKVEIFCFD